MKVVAIVQARVGSTRLPGKVLQDLLGQTMLVRVINRLRASRLIDHVVVATTNLDKDDAIVDECLTRAVACHRGDENDVLDRYFQAAKAAAADVIVRITSDCPLIDPEVTDRTIDAFLQSHADYAANTLVRTYPRGLDTEVFTLDALSRAWNEARLGYEREHVTPYIIEHPAEFSLLSVTGDRDYSAYRWTVDTPEDLQLVRAIYGRFPADRAFSWREVTELLEREPSLADLNSSITQKAIR